MEFPSLGKHCHQSDCKQLDFLPMKCDACSEIFCKDHIQYSLHSCPESYKKDNQVPVCPLCNSLVPVKSGESPDITVGRHIDSDCKSDTAKQRRKVYTNKCSFKGCKQKELIPVQCEKCRLNFCLRHRFEADHNCSGFEGSGQGMSRQGAAALARMQGTKASSSSTQPKKSGNPPPQRSSQMSTIGSQLNRERQDRQSQGRQLTQDQARSAQAGLSEEEAMARAIQMSLAETQKNQQNNQTLSQEDEDLLLAQALAASEEDARRERQRRQQQQQTRQNQDSNKTSCEVS